MQVFAQEEKADEALQAADNQPSSALDQKLEVASKEPVKSPKLDEAPTEELQKPNYPAWIVSLLVVIGTFYTVVFYAGTGAVHTAHHGCFSIFGTSLDRI